MKIITCHCEKNFDADIPDEIELDEEGEVLGQILEGRFLALTCPHCGDVIKPEVAVTLRSANRDGPVFRVVPESERGAWLDGRLEAASGPELLIGYAELYERALILRDGLDSAAIEVLKYYILAKALESADASAEPVVAYRGRSAEGKLSFGIEGLKPGELALLALPFDRYERTRKDLPGLAATEPFSAFLSGTYRSVRALETAQD